MTQQHSDSNSMELIVKRISEVGINTPEAALMRAIFERALDDSQRINPERGPHGLTINEIGRACEYLCGEMEELALIDIDPHFVKKMLADCDLKFNYYGARMSYKDLVIVVRVAEHRMEAMLDARDVEMARRRVAFRHEIAARQAHA